MRPSHRVISAILALATTAACSGKPAPSADLQRDLDLARGSALELAPRATGAAMAADELSPIASSPQKASARKREEPSARARTTAPDVAVAAAPTPTSSPVAAPGSDAAPATVRPAPVVRPAVTPAPRGGYKTMGEIIRKAPFPINP